MKTKALDHNFKLQQKRTFWFKCLCLRSHKAIFFDEGPGFLLERHLGKAQFGSTSLVTSVNDGQLYVRKEEFTPTKTTLKDGSFRSVREVANALAVSHIDGVVKLKGWIQYINNTTGERFMVTYWNFCNAGTMHELFTQLKQNNIRISEVWVAQWFVTMVDTILALHSAGLTHNDAHQNNWFFHHHPDAQHPYEVILGDFDQCKRKSEDSKWQRNCRQGFLFVLKDIIPFFGLERDQYGEISRTAGCVCSNLMLAILRLFDKVLWQNLIGVEVLHQRAQEICDATKARVVQADHERSNLLLPASPRLKGSSTWRHATHCINKIPGGYKCWKTAAVRHRRRVLPLVDLQPFAKDADPAFEPLATGDWIDAVAEARYGVQRPG